MFKNELLSNKNINQRLILQTLVESLRWLFLRYKF